MPQQARVAVIGTGWWATTTHIPGLQENPQANLVAICDSDLTKLHAAGETYHVPKMYSSYQTMLAQESLEGVVIATNHASHFAIARDCLAHGLHVMLEKPMTLYAQDARTLVDLAQAQQRELIIGYPYTYTPYAIQTQAALQRGELGAIQYLNCLFSSHIIELLHGRHNVTGPVHGPGTVYSEPDQSGGGHGHLQLTHLAGLLFFITGLRARRVHALMHRHGLALDVVDALTVEFEGGALGNIGGTANLGGGGGRKFSLQIFCEHGSIDLDVVKGRATIFRAGQDPTLVEPVTAEREGYRRYAPTNNMVDLIRGKGHNGSPAEVGWRAVELLDAAYRSAAQDGTGVAIADLY